MNKKAEMDIMIAEALKQGLSKMEKILGPCPADMRGPLLADVERMIRRQTFEDMVRPICKMRDLIIAEVQHA